MPCFALVARKISFDDPQTLLLVRVAYVVVQAMVLGTYYYVSAKIKRTNDQTILKYVEASNPMQGKEGELVVTTVRDYDLGETAKLIRSVLMGCGMMLFLHLYMGYTQPLFVQALMGLKGLYDAKPIALHILGKPAEGNLKRPFKAGPGIFGASNDPLTDKSAIDEAEKRAGSKKDE